MYSTWLNFRIDFRIKYNLITVINKRTTTPLKRKKRGYTIGAFP